MKPSPPARVLNLLRMGEPLRRVERWTGWPAGSIRRYATRQGWPRITPEEARALFARLQERRQQLGLTWVQVAVALGTRVPAMYQLRNGSGTAYTRDQAEAWLAKTTPPVHERSRS